MLLRTAAMPKYTASLGSPRTATVGFVLECGAFGAFERRASSTLRRDCGK
jgi:hypothetical protein